MNIYEKLAKISAEIANVSKNLSIQAGRESYKAVGEADVLIAVKPLEEKYGIYSYPFKREIVASDVFTKTNTYNGQTKETTQLFMRIKTTYRFVNVEKPDEFIDIDTYGDGVDSQDKAPGKAMTYADKYALLKAYKVTTGDDPDQSGSSDMGNGKNAQAGQSGSPGNNKGTPQSAPTVQQLGELKKIKRTLADVAKYCGVDEKAVTATQVASYIMAAKKYQDEKAKAQQSQLDAEADMVFGADGIVE